MPSPEIIALLLALACIFCALAGAGIGAAMADRKNQRENAATATCVGCDWTSGPVSLSEAFRAREAHRQGMEHHAVVERAQ